MQKKIKMKCEQQGNRGTIEFYEGCEGGASVGLFRGKCEKGTKRIINCSEHKPTE